MDNVGQTVTIHGLTMRGRVLASLDVDGPGTTRQLSDRFAAMFGYPSDDYWQVAGGAIVEALQELVGTRLGDAGVLGCVDEVWGLR